ncbi:protein regulator of cytokinesis 1 isoform 2-T2 [Ammospiza maritima maritima]
MRPRGGAVTAQGAAAVSLRIGWQRPRLCTAIGWGRLGGAARVAVVGGAAAARQPVSLNRRRAAMERGAVRKSEALANEAVSCLNRALAALRDIWEEIGIPEEQRLERTDVVRKHIKSLLDMMVAEEESLKERLLKSIAVCRKELDTLCRELQLGPFETEESTILQMEKNLRTCVEVLQKQKRDRKQELKALQEQDRALCDILCTALFSIDTGSVPSLDDLDRYRRHVASLNTLKEQRREEFVSNKRQIVLLMEELDHTPDTSFERDVVCEDEEAFCLSEDNIRALQNLLQQLERRRALNEALCAELRSRILALWERLQIPQEQRDSSAVHLAGSRARTRRALQQEVDRLEELKLQNMKSVIHAIRAELADYWDKCFYSQEQRERFSPFYDEDYTETLLELHDAEVGKMKIHYERHKDLFQAVQKWEENWKLFLELESKANDPSRFTNRGGNLLKEEKQRAKLQKTLSRLQEDLERKVQTWEEEFKGPFLVKGQQFVEYVSEQWQQYRLEKEKEKQERACPAAPQEEPGDGGGDALRQRPPHAHQAAHAQPPHACQTPRHLQRQHRVQHHCSLSPWGSPLPLAHLSAASLREEVQPGPDPHPPGSEAPPTQAEGAEQGERVAAGQNHPECANSQRPPALKASPVFSTPPPTMPRDAALLRQQCRACSSSRSRITLPSVAALEMCFY